MKMHNLACGGLAVLMGASMAHAVYFGAPNAAAADAASVYYFNGNLNDATGHGRTMREEVGPLTYGTGANGQALDVTAGKNTPATMLGLVDHGSDSSVIVNTSNFAVEMAVAVNSNGPQTFLGANSVPGWGGNDRVFALRANADQTDSSRIYFEFAVQDAGGNLLTASSPSVPFSSVQNQFIGIAGRSTGSTLELYINGILANSTNSAGANANFLTNQTVIRIGTDWGGGNRSDAKIDDLAIYNTARTNFQSVPEPASLAVLGLGGVALLRRRRA